MSDKNTNQEAPVYNRPASSSAPDNLRRLSSINVKKEKKAFVPKIGANKKKQKIKKEVEEPAFIKSQNKPKRLVISGKKKNHRPNQILPQKSVFEATHNRAPKRSRPSLGSSSVKTASSFSRDIKTKCEVESKACGEDEVDVNDLIKRIEEQQVVSEDETEAEADLAPIDYAEGLMDLQGEPLIEKTDPIGKNVGEILREHKDSNKLLYIQMPEKLPVKPYSLSEQEKENKPDVANKSKEQLELDAKLEKIGEGYVGKIQVMRDGTCKLVIGNIEFNITTGLHEPCYQEAVSVTEATSDNGNEGSVAHLGSFEKTLNIKLDLDQPDVLTQY